MVRVVFMGKDKDVVEECLAFLVFNELARFDVIATVVPNDSLALRLADSVGIVNLTDSQVYEDLDILKPDLVVSCLYPKKIKQPLIQTPRLGCINFHPAPLPKYRGMGGYGLAILNDEKTWGCTAHYVDEEFDTGAVIESTEFSVDDQETAISLEKKSMNSLCDLFVSVMGKVNPYNKLPSLDQPKEGRYTSLKEFEAMKTIDPAEDLESINRKIRAFWFPPYQGARIEIQGQSFTLVNNDILKTLEQ
jgi:methionyl-tRNA formyltransferase